MNTSTIAIEVDSDSARAYSQAPLAEQRKLQLLLALRLRELTACPTRPLAQVMDEIGAQAQARGMTPEVLESLLHGE
jgi:hypothetical protein